MFKRDHDNRSVAELLKNWNIEFEEGDHSVTRMTTSRGIPSQSSRDILSLRARDLYSIAEDVKERSGFSSSYAESLFELALLVKQYEEILQGKKLSTRVAKMAALLPGARNMIMRLEIKTDGFGTPLYDSLRKEVLRRFEGSKDELFKLYTSDNPEFRAVDVSDVVKVEGGLVSNPQAAATRMVGEILFGTSEEGFFFPRAWLQSKEMLRAFSLLGFRVEELKITPNVSMSDAVREMMAFTTVK